MVTTTGMMRRLQWWLARPSWVSEKSKFKITETDSLQKTLGFQIERTKTGGVFMHQHSYIQDNVKRFGMERCRAVETRLILVFDCVSRELMCRSLV